MSAGELSAYSSATRSSAAASTPATSAARSIVHSSARSRSRSAPCVCVAQERLVGVPVGEQVAVNRERDGDVGARPDREVHVRRARERRRARIDDDELRAALLRLAHVRDEMNAGRRRVDAPEHDQRGFGIVLVGDRRHLAVERHVGRAGRRRAHRARQPRRAEAPPQLRVEVVLGQQAVRAAVGVGQNRRAAVRRPSRAEIASATSSSASSHEHALEPALALCGPCGPRDRAAGPDRRRARRTCGPSRRCSRRSPDSCASRRCAITLPCCTVTARLHASGQSSGHAVSTTDRRAAEGSGSSSHDRQYGYYDSTVAAVNREP